MTKKNRTASFKKSLQRKKILVFKTMMDLATKKCNVFIRVWISTIFKKMCQFPNLYVVSKRTNSQVSK